MGSTVSIDFDITRNQLAAFVKDPRTIRDLEAFLRTVREEVPAVISVKVDDTRTIATDGTLTGGGDLSADRTLGVDLTAEAERVRDVIGTALVQGTGITITVNDAGDTITIAASASYTDENAQDAVGTILTDTTTIDFTYDDATPKITADVIPAPIRKLGITTSSGTTYTLSSSDVWTHVRFTSASAITLTVNTSHGFNPGERVRVTAAGTGQITLTPSSTTLNSRGSALKSAGQYAVLELECVGTNEFDVLGDVTT